MQLATLEIEFSVKDKGTIFDCLHQWESMFCSSVDSNLVIRYERSIGISHPQDGLSSLDQLSSSFVRDCFSDCAQEVFSHEVRKLKNSQIFQRFIARELVHQK